MIQHTEDEQKNSMQRTQESMHEMMKVLVTNDIIGKIDSINDGLKTILEPLTKEMGDFKSAAESAPGDIETNISGKIEEILPEKGALVKAIETLNELKSLKGNLETTINTLLATQSSSMQDAITTSQTVIQGSIADAQNSINDATTGVKDAIDATLNDTNKNTISAIKQQETAVINAMQETKIATIAAVQTGTQQQCGVVKLQTLDITKQLQALQKESEALNKLLDTLQKNNVALNDQRTEVEKQRQAFEREITKQFSTVNNKLHTNHIDLNQMNTSLNDAQKMLLAIQHPDIVSDTPDTAQENDSVPVEASAPNLFTEIALLKEQCDAQNQQILQLQQRQQKTLWFSLIAQGIIFLGICFDLMTPFL